MQINIKSTNLEMTSQINDYINKRLKFVKKMVKDDSGALCDVEVGRTTFHHKKGDVYRAEINLRTKGETLYASAEREDLYNAIDAVKNDIRSRLLSYKGKRETLLRRGGARVKGFVKGFWGRGRRG